MHFGIELWVTDEAAATINKGEKLLLMDWSVVIGQVELRRH